MHLFYLILSLLIAHAHCSYHGYNPYFNRNRTPFMWKKMQFGFPSEQSKDSGNFESADAVLIDVQPYYLINGNRIFVTLPKFAAGIPYSLAEISFGIRNDGPVLKPYPNYEIHNNENGRNCDAITSAFRVAIDPCERMWVIDSGMVGANTQCAPQLLVFDLETDDLVYRHRFNTSVYTPGASLFIAAILSVRDAPPKGRCSDIRVYIPDVNYHGLVVHDVKHNESWRIEDKSMYPEPNHGLMTVAGESFVSMDGIFGLATDNQNLYYHALASATEYFVPLEVIDNKSLFANGGGNMHKAFKPLGQRGGVCAASAMDSDGNLYCVTLNPIQLLQWNVNTAYDSNNIKSLHIHAEELEFVSGMKVVTNRNGQKEVWMVSNRFQKTVAGTRNFNETNFRIVVHLLENDTRNIIH